MIARRRRRRPDLVRCWALGLTSVTVLALVLIAGFLVWGSLPILRREGLGFLARNDWAYRRQAFGALSMLYGTACVSGIALVLAAPLGLFTALFSSEVCPPRARLFAKLPLELLAGVPSVVYGLLGVLFLRNGMAWLFESLNLDAPSGDTLLTAGLLLAVMILPTLATLADDALQSVPSRLRDAARGLGLTRAETTLLVVVPQARSGLLGALLLGLGRALGETIAVFLVVGRADNRLPDSMFSLRPILEAGQTLTSKLGGSETHIALGDPLHSAAILGLGLILFVGVAVLTLGAEALRTRPVGRT